MSLSEFSAFSSLIYNRCGIKLAAVKRSMLAARLSRRLRALGMTSFERYYSFLISAAGQEGEMAKMLDEVSTNKTGFFREPAHFDILRQTVLPLLSGNSRRRRRIKIWSAGCSSGEEPYTLAMVVDDWIRDFPWLDYHVLATDICTSVIEKGERAIYPDDGLTQVPPGFRQRYFMRGNGRRQGHHRLVPEIRKRVSFRRLNFMDPDFGFDRNMDIIFCRNVIIYFDRKTQRSLFAKFHKALARPGFIFTGHSESLEGVVENMKKVAPAVYQCRE